MRILVHDYSGHPFQVQLSRWLAGRGHRVRHVYSLAVETPRGPLAPRPDDPPTFDIRGLARGRRLAKYRLGARLVQEARYAELLAAEIRGFAPEVVLSGNCSPAIQWRAARAAHRRGAGFVAWVQDLYADALSDALGRRTRRLEALAGAALAVPLGRWVEAASWRASDAVVAIAPPFAERVRAAGVSPSRVAMIPNWAPPLDLPSDGGRTWRRDRGLAGSRVFLYAGTLGQKHEPARLVALARHFRDDPEVAVLVASEGPGRAALERHKAAEGLANLHLRGFFPYHELPAALVGADVLLALLSERAGGYAVPSKVLTALRAGRPILASLPAANPAATLLRDSGAGLAVAPGDAAGWLDAADRLRGDPALRARLGAAGPAAAGTWFDIDVIGARFLTVLRRARAGSDEMPHAKSMSLP